ncbi:MAG TPA: hypothetical protein VLE96_04525 [Chlamydiales bacterium]|nr:hypothetical protein [Chlamydiales bacterium]
MTIDNAFKYSSISCAWLVGAGAALVTGTAWGIGVGSMFLYECDPKAAFGSCLFTVFSQQEAVWEATRAELSSNHPSIKKIFKSAIP